MLDCDVTAVLVHLHLFVGKLRRVGDFRSLPAVWRNSKKKLLYRPPAFRKNIFLLLEIVLLVQHSGIFITISCFVICNKIFIPSLLLLLVVSVKTLLKEACIVSKKKIKLSIQSVLNFKQTFDASGRTVPVSVQLARDHGLARIAQYVVVRARQRESRSDQKASVVPVSLSGHEDHVGKSGPFSFVFEIRTSCSGG